MSMPVKQSAYELLSVSPVCVHHGRTVRCKSSISISLRLCVHTVRNIALQFA